MVPVDFLSPGVTASPPPMHSPSYSASSAGSIRFRLYAHCARADPVYRCRRRWGHQLGCRRRKLRFLPTLLFVGIPPVQANATNTVALWPGQPASVWAYRHEFRSLPRRVLVPLTVTGIVGGVLGAYTLLITPQATFMRVVPWLLLIATLIFTMSGRITRWVRRRAEHGEHHEFATGRGIYSRCSSRFTSATSEPAPAFFSSPCKSGARFSRQPQLSAKAGTSIRTSHPDRGLPSRIVIEILRL